jgi:ABC-type transport system involved in multi-copper enzyme maturation permease subunit
MFREIFRFELRQQLKSPLFWMIALAFLALAAAVISSDHVRIGGGIGNTLRNAPYVIVNQLALIGAILSLFLGPIFVAGAALRDFEAGTSELFFATPISKRAYLGGRFAAGYAIALAVMVFVAIGMLLGVMMPWVDPQRLGPTSFAAYGYAFGVVLIPDFLFVSAMLFLLATLTRSMLGTYIGVIAFFVLWTIAGVATDSPDHQTLGAIIDPFGLGAFDVVTRYWSAEDRNTKLPEITGLFLINRVLWVGIGLAMIAAAVAWFRPDREGLSFGRRRKSTVDATPAVATHASLTSAALPPVELHTGFSARFAQYRKLAAFDTRGVLTGIAFLVMLILGLFNLGAAIGLGNELFGTKLYPLTHLLTEAMDGSYNFLLVIIIGFYAGELVWRERGARISEVTDAFSLPDWIPLLSKLTAMTAVIFSFLVAGALECVAYQLIKGYTLVEPGLYLSGHRPEYAALRPGRRIRAVPAGHCQQQVRRLPAVRAVLRQPHRADAIALRPSPVQLRQRTGPAVLRHERLRPFPRGAPVVPRLLGRLVRRPARRRRAVLVARHGARAGRNARASRASVSACRRARCSPDPCSSSPASAPGSTTTRTSSTATCRATWPSSSKPTTKNSIANTANCRSLRSSTSRSMSTCIRTTARSMCAATTPSRTRPTSRSATCTCACRST